MIKQFINNKLSVVLSVVVCTMPLKSNINSITIILLLAYCLFFIYSKRKEVVFLPTKAVIILIIPFLFILMQGFYSEWNSYSKNLVRSLPLILFPVLFYYLKFWLDSKLVKIVLTSLVCSSIAYSVFLLGFALYRQFLFMPDFSTINWYFFTYYDFTEVLDIHPTYLGMYLCLAFTAVLYRYLNTKNNPLITILLLGFLGLTIFLVGSRIALTCLVLIIIYLLAFKIKTLDKTKRIMILLLITMIPVLVLNFIPIVKERMIDMTFGLKTDYEYAKYGDDGKDNNYNGGFGPRLKIWHCAVDVGNYNPFIGSGFGFTQQRLNTCYNNSNLEAYAKKDYQTHSQYFNSYARGGVLGLCALLLLYIYSVVVSLSRKQVLHFGFLIIIVVASVTENILNRHMGIVFFAFFNSLFFFNSISSKRT
ncbi:O-antigen ligase family protein [Bizionia paragorgiae]|uniref:O-antigen ligase n=1 Tax=Bizionia paragorgiae TaxID=283786 RepID=A0A1H3W1U1_BIZPA|nr:O-antigen ligase family protein [Bizionia paragorgiae]SDZ80999.1 O-antigen ligase [Bizionia paragorgiae]